MDADSAPMLTRKLPNELERVIFLDAAISRPANIPALILVAWRVKHWVEPLLYHIVCLSRIGAPMEGYPRFTIDVMLRAIQRKPASFFHDNVQHLCLNSGSTAQQAAILRACTGVKNLCIPNHSLEPHLDAIDAMAPCRLMFSHDLSVSFGDSIFRNITHLSVEDVGNARDEGNWAPDLHLIPNLTHFSFYLDNISRELGPPIAACPRLQCIVMHCYTNLEMVHVEEIEQAWLSNDIRFVMIRWDRHDFFGDWQRGAATGQDFWVLAEASIAAKRASDLHPRMPKFSSLRLTAARVSDCLPTQTMKHPGFS
ncbi:hypothetical protein B0H16DRAFT_351706 [Mycena metata]|uniref:Uncharacterized protein n=1 Tax=Mycena metata TaxID=1033252 RepID=A0AAD7JMD5_9AGAR|nr:hypothetical protein B0H16DRAFT_351706 [Mycena metata]